MDSQEEEIVQLLTDSTNRAIVTILDDGDRELSVSELADRIVSADTAPVRSSDSDSENEHELEQTIISLHHIHLPRLDEAGLIEYDHDENVATSSNLPSVEAEWMDIEVLDELFSRFRAGNVRDESAVGLLEGSEDIYRYCREAVDEAENELFLIYASRDLLDEDCLPYAENAIERGVTFHAGTKSQSAREFFRESLPEATIWDPQMDWMYDQSNCPKVSRLVVADREKVAVGLWNEGADETKTEVAMIGEGETNPLVVLVRELLGPRLDHLDYQSDDFIGNLPFEV